MTGSYLVNCLAISRSAAVDIIWRMSGRDIFHLQGISTCKTIKIKDLLNSQKRLSRPLSMANWDKQEEPLKGEQEMEEVEEEEEEEVKRVFRPLQLLTACFGALRYLNPVKI